MADLRVLIDSVPGGLFPAAGIPWYSVPFGRDSLITGLQTLLFKPAIAAGTLRHLARFQGTKMDAWRDEEPGKILHEIRVGEMARLGEVPHTPYYGSVDATPLFLILIGEHAKWTGSLRVFNELKGNVEAALNWIAQYGDCDGDGYAEYYYKT